MPEQDFTYNTCIHTPTHTQRRPWINLWSANRKPSSCTESVLCFPTPVRESSDVSPHSPFWYVVCVLEFNAPHLITAKWIWEKVNCSVKLGNWVLDVGTLITWHFYYSTSRKEKWRNDDGGKKKDPTNKTPLIVSAYEENVNRHDVKSPNASLLRLF